MIQFVIFEDEKPAQKRIERLLSNLDQPTEVVGMFDTVTSAVKELPKLTYDLILADIQLADGLSFEIFDQLRLQKPVIFTTAFDAYTLKAFKVHSVDYLLKPINQEELSAALQQFEALQPKNGIHEDVLRSFLQQSAPKTYKQHFVLKVGQHIHRVASENIAYFYFHDGINYLYTTEDVKYAVDETLDHLLLDLDPTHFFRINRNMIVSSQSIAHIHSYFSGRYKLNLKPATNEDAIVSRQRAKAFMQWLEG